jgi:hypothetical protein
MRLNKFNLLTYLFFFNIHHKNSKQNPVLHLSLELSKPHHFKKAISNLASGISVATAFWSSAVTIFTAVGIIRSF